MFFVLISAFFAKVTLILTKNQHIDMFRGLIKK